MPERLSFFRTLSGAGYWSSDRGLSALLVAVIVLEFVILPLEASGRLGLGVLLLVDLWTAGVLVAGTSALGWHRMSKGLVGLTAVMVGALLAVHFTSRAVPLTVVEALRSALTALFFAGLTALIMAHVLREGPTTRHRILGAVAAYLLIGFVFANVFRLIQVVDGAALQGVQWAPGESNLFGFTYFSLSTLSTLGYGDVLPVSRAARAAASFEALLGQLFLAILIARLVSLEVAARSSPR